MPIAAISPGSMPLCETHDLMHWQTLLHLIFRVFFHDTRCRSMQTRPAECGRQRATATIEEHGLGALRADIDTQQFCWLP